MNSLENEIFAIFGLESEDSTRMSLNNCINRIFDAKSKNEDISFSDGELTSMINWLEELKEHRDNQSQLQENKVSLDHISQWRDDNADFINKTPDGKKDRKSLISFFKEKVYEEIDEAIEAHEKNEKDHTEDECGDVINTVVALVKNLGVCPAKASRRGHDKLRRRVSVLREGGTWDDAKKAHPN